MAASFLAGEKLMSDPPDLTEQTVFINTSNPEMYIVYLTTKTNWL